jgi:hypothetical protein
MVAVAGFSQTAATFQRAYIADATGTEVSNNPGTVRIVESTGRIVAPPAIKDQQSCSDPKISPNKRTAGWLANFPNGSTSYDIPLVLVLYRNGKIVQTIAPGQMIHDWNFWKEEQVALSDGPTHGDFGPQFHLYDITTGRLLKEWNGEGGRPPDWGNGLRQ